jgi:hypothetical protein
VSWTLVLKVQVLVPELVLAMRRWELQLLMHRWWWSSLAQSAVFQVVQQVRAGPLLVLYRSPLLRWERCRHSSWYNK